MNPFNGNQVQNNSNVYHAELFREIAFTSFVEDLLSATVADMISDIHKNMFGAVIRQPEIDRTKIVINERDAYQCEVDINSTIETDETVFTMDKTLDATFEVCPWDEAYTTMNLTAEAQKIVNEEMILAVDKYILDKALNLATLTVPAIADAATAKAAVTAANVAFIGKRANKGMKTIVAAASMYPFFEELFTSRISVLGDSVLLSGELATISGWNVVFTDDAQMTNPAEVIFAVGKPLDTYIDEAGFSSITDRYKESADSTKVNLNKLHITQLNIGSTLWKGNEPYLLIAR